MRQRLALAHSFGSSNTSLGVASTMVNLNSVGVHDITARFNSSVSGEPSTSAAISVSYNAYPTAISMAATPNASAYGAPVSLIATFSAYYLSPSIGFCPQGSVKFPVFRIPFFPMELLCDGSLYRPVR